MGNPFEAYLTAIEQALHQAVAAPHADHAPLYNMLAYHLGFLDAQFRPSAANSGKRVRPLVCLLACEAAGGDWHDAVPAAAAIELIHNFSLIHDDIEDNSATRRGRSAVWSLWGMPHGINAGDMMLILAHETLASLDAQRLGTARVLDAIHLLDRICMRLCEGQYLDMAFEGRLDVTEAAYTQMIGGKTAALLASSAAMGALLAGAEENVAHYAEFGRQVGLTFQMVDDILGIWGAPEVTGKSVASDIEARKMTLPVIVALLDPAVGPELTALYQQPTLSAADVARAVALLDRTNAQEYTQQLARQHEQQALAAFAASGATGPAADHLRELARSMTVRKK